MTKNQKIIMVVLALSLLKPVMASDFNKVGTTGFVFLQIPVTARFAALGETGITLPDMHSEGIYVNPALIALNEKKLMLNVNYADWYVETSHQAIGMTYRMGTIGTIGLHAMYLDFGEIVKTRNPFPTETGSYVKMGTYSASSFTIGLSFARMLTEQFSFGATVKYVSESIDQSNASNAIVDIGFIYFTGMHSLRVGAFLQNFGLDTKYIEQKFKMPQLMKLGISAEIWGDLADPNHITALAEVAHPNDIDEHLQFGLEATLMNHFIFRSGYKFGFDAENLSLGLGLRFNFKGNGVRFDAAYMNHDYLESTMRYSLIMEF